MMASKPLPGMQKAIYITAMMMYRYFIGTKSPITTWKDSCVALVTPIMTLAPISTLIGIAVAHMIVPTTPNTAPPMKLRRVSS
jgi:hypothetical protein